MTTSHISPHAQWIRPALYLGKPMDSTVGWRVECSRLIDNTSLTDLDRDVGSTILTLQTAYWCREEPGMSRPSSIEFRGILLPGRNRSEWWRRSNSCKASSGCTRAFSFTSGGCLVAVRKKNVGRLIAVDPS
jgi:hypothetical protein